MKTADGTAYTSYLLSRVDETPEPHRKVTKLQGKNKNTKKTYVLLNASYIRN